MNIDFDVLKAELQDDPEGIGYAGKVPAAVFALLKTPYQVEVFVPLRDLQSLLMETVVPPSSVPVLWVLKAASASDPLAEMAFDLFTSRLDNLNTRGAFQSAALSQMQASGLIDQDTRDKIDAMATQTKTRGEIVCGRMPTLLEVQLVLLGG